MNDMVKMVNFLIFHYIFFPRNLYLSTLDLKRETQELTNSNTLR